MLLSILLLLHSRVSEDTSEASYKMAREVLKGQPSLLLCIGKGKLRASPKCAEAGRTEN
jgi:hypothetical protein